ncbi:MAG: hypothetical protein WGN25_02020 [Candidatus Electrothrix sp. GW3-4]|uniref:hypothetical protein n=1 Tax=Candidatus Electrothrix sp. GW3-4 TaxID=3126740 RepID=UPI0030CE4C06
MNRLILLFCLILVASSVSAQKKLPCLNLTAVDNPSIAYTQRGDRCEGFYQSPVSAESLSLVSLLYGRLDFDGHHNDSIQIVAPQIKTQQVHIQAVGIPLRTYYRLDAWIQPGEKLTWPLNVIDKMQLRLTDIGLLGQPVAEAKFYTPLMVGDQAIAPLNMILRSSVDVQTLLWRRSEMNERQCAQHKGEWQNIEPVWGDYFFSGEAILLSLPDQADNFCIEFAAQTKGSGSWLKLAMGILLKE